MAHRDIARHKCILRTQSRIWDVHHVRQTLYGPTAPMKAGKNDRGSLLLRACFKPMKPENKKP